MENISDAYKTHQMLIDEVLDKESNFRGILLPANGKAPCVLFFSQYRESTNKQIAALLDDTSVQEYPIEFQNVAIFYNARAINNKATYVENIHLKNANVWNIYGDVLVIGANIVGNEEHIASLDIMFKTREVRSWLPSLFKTTSVV
jgi:hypothetical protein